LSETTSAWQDTSLPPGERARKLVEAMTLEQKIAQLHGAMETIDIYAITAQAAESGADMDQLAAQIQVERHVRAIDELGIPRFRITNGPVGVGMGDGTPSPPATSLPMTIGLAAGFDPDLARAYGDIIGSETATLGQHVLEGPGVCLHRTTIAGRAFEYFSEDPYLTGVIGVPVAKAIQAHDVIAMAEQADVVVLMAGLVATEGADQPDANMLNDQNRMLDELLGINPSTVVVLKDSNPVLMPWIDKAPAVLEPETRAARTDTSSPTSCSGS
jgi:hypothetical protein